MTDVKSSEASPGGSWPPSAPAGRLFKYTSFDTARIVLSSGRLRWTTPPLLNDPYDMSFDLHLDADPDVVRKAALEMLWSDYHDDSRPAPLAAFEAWKASRKRPKKMNRAEFDRWAEPGVDLRIGQTAAVADMHRQVQALMQGVKLLCLTDDPGNMLMWSHYGQQHYGAVLMFDCEPEGSQFQAARPVIYATGMPRLGDSRTLAGVIAGRGLDTARLIEAQIYTKAADWRYEREWRIQFGRGRDHAAPHEDLKFGDELLTGLVVGCRMPEENRDELARLARALNPAVDLYAALPAACEFRIDLIPLRLPGG